LKTRPIRGESGELQKAKMKGLMYGRVGRGVLGSEPRQLAEENQPMVCKTKEAPPSWRGGLEKTTDPNHEKSSRRLHVPHTVDDRIGNRTCRGTEAKTRQRSRRPRPARPPKSGQKRQGTRGPILLWNSGGAVSPQEKYRTGELGRVRDVTSRTSLVK